AGPWEPSRPIMRVMTSESNARTFAATSCTLALALVLAACGTPLQEEADAPEGGSADGSMDQVQASAPDPAGDQHSHEQMREALEENIAGAEITDTDDW